MWARLSFSFSEGEEDFYQAEVEIVDLTTPEKKAAPTAHCCDFNNNNVLLELLVWMIIYHKKWIYLLYLCNMLNICVVTPVIWIQYQPRFVLKNIIIYILNDGNSSMKRHKLLECHTFYIYTAVVTQSLKVTDQKLQSANPHFYLRQCGKVRWHRPTFRAAGPPQTWVGQDLLVLVDGLVVAQALGATHPTGVEPVVRAHGDGHEAEGAESPRRGQQHHHAPVTQPHVGFTNPTQLPTWD